MIHAVPGIMVLILKVFWEPGAGSGKKRLRVDEEADWSSFRSQIETLVGFKPVLLVDEDECEIDSLDVLENGLKVWVRKAAASGGSEGAVSPASPATSLIVPPSPREVAEEAMEALPDHASASKLLSLLRLVLKNLLDAKGDAALRKFQTVSVKKLNKAAKSDAVGQAARKILAALGFADITSRGKELTLSTDLASSSEYLAHALSLLDQLFIESRRTRQSQSQLSSPVVVSLNNGARSEVSKSKVSHHNFSWSDRHQVINSANDEGLLDRPLLSSERLRIFLDELAVRRELLKGQQHSLGGSERLERLRVRVFDAEGRNLSAMDLAAEHSQEVEVKGDEDEDDDEDQGHVINNATIQRARLLQLQLRALSVEKERRFRSKDSVKLEKLQRKDKRYKRTLLKVGQRGGISISAKFSSLETCRDVLRCIVTHILSTEAAVAIKNGSLDLVLTCRILNESSATQECARSSKMFWPDIHLSDGGSLGEDVIEDCGMSLLELRMVPRGRIWINVVALRGSKSRDFKDLLRPELSQLFDQVDRLPGDSV